MASSLSSRLRPRLLPWTLPPSLGSRVSPSFEALSILGHDSPTSAGGWFRWTAGLLLGKLPSPFGSRTISGPAWHDGVPKEEVECVVIGAGVVGLAIARKLSACGHHVILLESQSTFGTGISSRNSEVIHAGIYYPPNSLKAQLCVEGKKKLYEYCKDRTIPHKPIGKLVVATSHEQLPKLLQLQKNAEESGVLDIKLLKAVDAQAMESNLNCVAALHSPSTGIVDSHLLMEALKDDAESNGCIISFNSTFVRGDITSSGFLIHVCDTNELNHQEESFLKTLDLDAATKSSINEPSTFNPQPSIILNSKRVINAAGLEAVFVAKIFSNGGNAAPAVIPDLQLARGNYFSLNGFPNPPFSRLIYPLPQVGGLGIHYTLDLARCAKFGPDVEWMDPPSNSFRPFHPNYGYDVDPERGNRFYEDIRKYFPGLPDHSLTPAYSGIRPKIRMKSNPNSAMNKESGAFADFLIQKTEHYGSCQLVNLLGVESPGLTSALSIADLVHSLLIKDT